MNWHKIDYNEILPKYRDNPPYNKMVLICYIDDPNVYLGYLDCCYRWHVLKGIYTGGVKHDLQELTCFPDAWADFPKNPFMK